MRQAITILLFEYIDLPGISTSSSYMSEQVNQMVAAQLNSLTKTTIKGIDISFGIDTYTQGTSSGGEQTKTSLSYEVKKNLLNDRVKVEISGIASGAGNQSNSANTSLNNFSFEYRIDSASTKFLKVYNEHSYEDVFESDVVKTGLGFTYRKNYPSLSDIWRKKEKIVQQVYPEK
jgi:translocation and assembly module TamB